MGVCLLHRQVLLLLGLVFLLLSLVLRSVFMDVCLLLRQVLLLIILVFLLLSLVLLLLSLVFRSVFYGCLFVA